MTGVDSPLLLMLVQFARRHIAAFVLAAIAGILSAGPMLIAPQKLGEAYHGIPYLYQDNEVVYLSRIRELQDGYRSVSSPFLHEYKEGRVNLMPPIGEHLYWLPAHLLGISLTMVLVASKFVFPALLFLILYALVFSALPSTTTIRRLSALAGASLAVLGFDLAHLSEVLSIVTGASSEVYLSVWTRLVHPISGALFLFSFLFSIRQVLEKRWWWSVPSSIFLALSIGYIFAFGMASASLGLFVLVALLFREWRVAGTLLAVGAGSMVLVTPHLMAVLPTVGGTGTYDALQNGMFLAHTPLISKVLLGALVVMLAGLVFDVRRHTKLSLIAPQIFFTSVLFAGLCAMNQQVLTGRTVWPQHFVQFTTPLVYLSLISWYALYIAPRLGRLASLVPLSLIGLSIAFAVAALPTYRFQMEDFARINRYAPLISTLNSLDAPCVVMPIERVEHLNFFITALTSCDSYSTHYTFVGVPPERVRHNFFVHLRFQGVTPSTLAAYLDERPELIWRVFFRDWEDYFYHSHDPWLTEVSDREEVEKWIEDTTREIIADYALFYKQDFHDALLMYRLDYVVSDSAGDTDFDATKYPFLEPIEEKEGIVLYRVK